MNFIQLENDCHQILLGAGVSEERLTQLRELVDTKKCAEIIEEEQLGSFTFEHISQVMSSYVSCQAFRIADWQNDEVYRAAFDYISQDLDKRLDIKLLKAESRDRSKMPKFGEGNRRFQY